MQPQQPYYPPASPPQPDNTGQYDFIVNHGAPSRQPNPKKMTLYVIGGLGIFIILAWIILSLAFGSKGGATAPLVTIAQEQAEMVRITQAAAQSNHLSSQDTHNFVSSTGLTLGTDQAQLVAFLARNGTKLNAKQLALRHSTSTDAALDAAAASDTYDSTLTSILQTQLQSYQTSLKQAYAGAKSTTEKTLLNTDYSNATLLLAQSTQHN